MQYKKKGSFGKFEECYVKSSSESYSMQIVTLCTAHITSKKLLGRLARKCVLGIWQFLCTLD